MPVSTSGCSPTTHVYGTAALGLHDCRRRLHASRALCHHSAAQRPRSVGRQGYCLHSGLFGGVHCLAPVSRLVPSLDCRVPRAVAVDIQVTARAHHRLSPALPEPGSRSAASVAQAGSVRLPLSARDARPGRQSCGFRVLLPRRVQWRPRHAATVHLCLGGARAGVASVVGL